MGKKISGKSSCLLCRSGAEFFCTFRMADYYRCNSCHSVFMEPSFHPSPEREKQRYLTHKNDINDPGYRAYVRPLTDLVERTVPKGGRGLDYGAGPGPVAADILGGAGFSISLYDPFFHNYQANLQTAYDFIICSEVIEHFHDPAGEFGVLRGLLQPGGILFCMTELLPANKDFVDWWYKNDETHVFFYHPRAIEWIRQEYSFRSATISGKIITFRAG